MSVGCTCSRDAEEASGCELGFNSPTCNDCHTPKKKKSHFFLNNFQINELEMRTGLEGFKFQF